MQKLNSYEEFCKNINIRQNCYIAKKMAQFLGDSNKAKKVGAKHLRA